MQNLKLLRERIKRNEGLRNSPYFDQLGNLTIGYGHLIKHNETFILGKKYSKSLLRQIFEKDFNVALGEYNKNYKKHKYTKNTSDVLIEMIFQVGIDKQKKFKKMNKYIKQNMLFMAAFEMKNSLWYTQTPKRVNNLVQILLKKNEYKK